MHMKGDTHLAHCVWIAFLSLQIDPEFPIFDFSVAQAGRLYYNYESGMKNEN